MAGARDLLVRVFGDTRDVERAFQRSNAAATQFGASVETTGKKADRAAKNFRGLATGAAAGFGGAVVFNEVSQQLNAAISVASNLQEQMSRTGVVFGESADEIVAWSRTTAKSIGVAADQALEAAGTFGAMFDQAGRSAADASRLSQSVVRLASDLASFNNTSIDEALVALRSGLSGEIEPLRRFQVFLTEATVAAEAMARSGKNNAKELTQGEKIMARWALILRQTSKQQGDFARTSDGLANSQRILAAQTRDLQSQVGSALLPIMQSFTGVLVDATAVALELADALAAIGRVKLPTIVIPFTTKEIGGGTFGGAAGKVAGIGLLGAISPAALFAVGIKEAIDRIRGEQPPSADINRLAGEFDSQFSAFTDQAVAKVNESVAKTNSRIKGFGQKGFKPIDVNPLGEELQNQFENSLAALDLKFDQAEFRGNSEQALKVLADIEATIRRRIATQGRTNELMRQLFEVERQREGILDANRDAAAATAKAAKDLAAQQAATARETQRAIREAAKAQKQADEFRALGLSRTGDEIVPGVANLQKRVAGALRRISSGELDAGTKVVDRLKLARKLLKKEGKGLEEDTRRVINDLLSTLKQGADKLESGPLTKTTSLSGNRLLAGLGLSPEQERELRQRVAGFNSAGKALTGRTSRPARFDGTAPVIVESHTTVNLDGETVGRNVTKTQQKRARRNPVQKRGPNSGI